MGTLPLQVVAAFAITSFAGVLMLKYGVSARMLERRPLRCRTCGGVRGRSCTCGRR
jgi:hypothetical protein